MTPILILLIAFTATLVISSSFRNTFSHIQINFQLPQISIPHIFFPKISFPDLSLYVQEFESGTVSFSTVLSAILLSSMPTVAKTSMLLSKESLLLIRLLDPRPFYTLSDILIFEAGKLIFSITELALSALWMFFVMSFQKSISFGTATQSDIFRIVATTTNTLLAIVQIGIKECTAVLSNFVQMVLSFFLLCEVIAENGFLQILHAAISFFIFCGITIGNTFTQILHAIIFTVTILWSWIDISVSTAFWAIMYTLKAIIHVIEIPFTVLNAFWLQIKPYVIIFERHIAMTGNDFSNSVGSFEKVTSLLSSTK